MKIVEERLLKKINLHRLGDIGCPFFGVLAKGKLLRSGNIEGLTKNELKMLESLNIHTRIDLRTDNEMINKPCQLLTGETINFQISAGDRNETYIDTIKSLDDKDQIKEVSFRSYQRLLENSFENVGRLLEYLARMQLRSTLIHCFSGKDRTGIVMAILLRILDINIEDIILDYQRAVNVYAINNHKNNVVFFKEHGIDYLKYKELVEPSGDIIKNLIGYIENRHEKLEYFLYKRNIKHGLFIKERLKDIYLL